ncbi:hypothetical protein [Streptomyces tauricus]|uniref:hypothetical protein n=1 Tax=Streptomyces tauricus TaxID=68274 RepID=UPI0033A72CCD
MARDSGVKQTMFAEARTAILCAADGGIGLMPGPVPPPVQFFLPINVRQIRRR